VRSHKLQRARRILSTAGPRALVGHIGSWLAHWSRASAGRRNFLLVDDPYLEWVMPAHGGWLQRGNLYCLDYALRRMPADTAILEIGAFCGLSTTVIAYFRAQAGRPDPFFVCDRWDMADPGTLSLRQLPHISPAEYSAFIKDSFIRNQRQFGRGFLPFAIEAWSDDFYAAWRSAREVEDVFGRTVRLGGPLGFVYIDGNHHYDYARRDFENTNEFLVPGGFVLFDDSADASGQDPASVAREVSRRPDYELVLKNPNCLFRKIA
jgi:hypothetical protein